MSLALVPETLLGAVVAPGPAELVVDAPLIDQRSPDGGCVLADRRRALVTVPGVADYLIEDGARVTLDTAAGAHPADVEAYLYATVTALLLVQQGRFAIHGTLVDVDDRVIAVAGRSGAGKSTTALALRSRGHALLCDDVTPLEPRVGETRYVPTDRPIRLTAETADALQIDVSGSPPRGPQARKFALPHAAPRPGRLDAVVLLRPAGVAGVESEPTPAVRSVPMLQRNAFRGKLLAPWRAELFAWAAGIADTVGVHVLARPERGWTVDAVATEVEAISGRLSAPA